MQDQLPEQIQAQVEEGIEILRKGGVIAFPTDTVYGLGAGIHIESAVKRVFQVKQRPAVMALPVLVADVPQIHEVAQFIPAYAWRLVEHFFPGALTLVVYRTKAVNDIITAGGDTVAIRIPAHPVPIALIKGCGMPLIGTSANISGSSSMLTAEEVKTQLGDTVDLIIDGVPAPDGRESTVVDVTGDVPVILRLGAISKAEIEKALEVVA
jgi:L-threonylcarbamoyladenylate synthase